MQLHEQFKPKLYSLIEHQTVLGEVVRAWSHSDEDESALRQVAEELGSPYAAASGDLPSHDLLPGAAAGAAAAAAAPTAGPGPAVHTGDEQYQVDFLAGMVPVADAPRFERVIRRASKRNAFVRFTDVPVPLLDSSMQRSEAKAVFMVYFRLPSLRDRLTRLADSLGTRYEVPPLPDRGAVNAVYHDIRSMQLEIRAQAAHMKQWRSALQNDLHAIAGKLELWRMCAVREQAIWGVANLMRQQSGVYLQARGWVRARHVDQLRTLIASVHSSGAEHEVLPHVVEELPCPDQKMPTYFQLNAWTAPFQGLVNTYGVPRYREANPALFATITFPFLFGVMYGDVGHGLALSVASGLLVLFERKIAKSKLGEAMAMLFPARYMLLAMGLFGMYAGALYNDFFALPIKPSGDSTWEWHDATPVPANASSITQVAVRDSGHVYPFGVDPVWRQSENHQQFFNSLKMKMSIVLGVCHMLFSIGLKVSNALYERSRADLWLEAIPQVVFFSSLFGYMVILILGKWATDWSLPGAGQPPSLIDTLINVVLAPGTVQDPLYSGQAGLQVFLLLLAGACVPIMLLGKPYLAWKAGRPHAEHGGTYAELSEPVEHDGLSSSAARSDRQPLRSLRAKPGDEDMVGSDEDARADPAGLLPPPAAAAAGAADGVDPSLNLDEEEEAHGFGDVLMHQGIETVEFVLGSVSNTASYLRLWALSLAHSELAAVFWDSALKPAIETGNPAFAYIGAAVFMGATTGVLLMMDVLEVFLHAMRLLWVESMNKHFKGGGHAFSPLRLQDVMRGEAPTL